MHSYPLISVGVPVYNEEKYISKTLDSLLSQDYPNLEIVISDNSSDDGTSIICQRYASNHPSIVYHRHKINRGPGFNFEYALTMANGEYFMWASGHDLWNKRFISICHEALTESSNTVLCFGPAFWISSNGDSLNRVSGGFDTSGLSIISRFNMVFWGNMHPVLGLINTELLRSTSIINTVGSDLLILTNLCLHGNFAYRSDAVWSRREFRNEQTYSEKIKRYKSNQYLLAKSRISKFLPLARLPIELIRIVASSNIQLHIKSLILVNLFLSFPIRYIAGKFIRE
ncbi:glycosyltransferase family 2 protein [Sedimenticola hydrogenitrophicus]|uniref:glycosyltransferase family 2 protein n=1 Tax=Sedimenticola hydrogenitrophicus TaxID=2967975 RepID=UPI003B589CA7